MKLINSFLTSLLVSSGCGSVKSLNNTLNSNSEPTAFFITIQPEEIKLNIEKPSKKKSKFYVPKIKFDQDVNKASVGSFKNALDEVLKENPKAIILEIFSSGGSVWDGFQMGKMIEESPVPIHCVVDGKAYSMAFIILQSCTTRSATIRSSLMLHQASVGTNEGGDQFHFQDYSDMLRVLSNSMTMGVANRMGIDPKWLISRIMTSPWWFTAEEAFQSNAIDRMADTVKQFSHSLRQCSWKTPLRCQEKNH